MSQLTVTHPNLPLREHLVLMLAGLGITVGG
jgi:hypothetical protein